MKLLQSDRRLNTEISRIHKLSIERKLDIEKRVLEEGEDFLVFLDSELQIEIFNFHFLQIRDGSEILLRLQ